VLQDLKIAPGYDGFLFLAESVRNLPILQPHHHVELELNLVTEGQITYVIEGRRVTFGQREMLWIFPSQEHQLVDRTPDAAYFVAVFTPSMIRRNCRGPRYRDLRKKSSPEEKILHRELPPGEFAETRQAMEALLVDGIDPDLLNREAGFGLSEGFSFRHHDPDWLNAGLHHLLLHSWRLQQGHQSRLQPVTLHPAVRKALRRVNDPGCLEESGRETARHCGVSPAYLSRMFHRQIGVPLTRYRNSVRLGRFWEAYRAGGSNNFLEAVYAAGFGSYPQFFRVFTEAYGKGPRELLRISP
jgi:AraC-like DNA-binding protein